MNDFIKAFSGVIHSEKFKNKHQFSLASGASSSYLHEIFNRGKLPTINKLQSWCQKAKIPQGTFDHLSYLLSIEKAKEDPNTAPIVEAWQRERHLHVRLIRGIVDFCSKKGLKLPKELADQLHLLDFGDE